MNIFQKIKHWFTVHPDPLRPVTPPVPAPSPKVPTVLPHELDATVQLLMTVINSCRFANHRQPCNPNLLLCVAAQQHANLMARLGMSHQEVGEHDPARRLNDQGYNYLTMGEIVAEGQPTPTAVVPAWYGHPPHRVILLGDFQEFGAGVAYSTNGTPYWCVDFASPQTPGGL
jgi:uncharacterized protein YkwD